MDPSTNPIETNASARDDERNEPQVEDPLENKETELIIDDIDDYEGIFDIEHLLA